MNYPNYKDINNINIKLLYINTKNEKRIKQKFSVTFLSNEFLNINYYLKSGLPEYLQNKPVLFSFTDGERNVIYVNDFQFK